MTKGRANGKSGVPLERLGVCLEMALSDRPFERRIEAAGKLGFRNAEMWFVDGSYRGDPETLAKAADRAGVRITNTVIGAPDGSVGGGLTDPARRDEWLERARMTFDWNRRAGIPATIVCTGNLVAGSTPEAMRRSVLEGLERTVELAEAAGIDLYLEPLNIYFDHAGYFLTGSDDAAQLCREVGSKRLRLLFDCYHMQIMEGNLMAHIERNLDVIGHVHIAGVPGRNEPDSGEVNYPFILSRMVELGYKGFFGLEYAPLGDHEESLRRTANHLTGAIS
jgi:hydroxypyruvate isomerase